MWLFDDILKKPQEKAPVDPLMQWESSTPPAGSGTGSSGWQPPHDDGTQGWVTPVYIQKTTETSLFDTSPRVDMSDLRIQEASPVILPRAESNTDTLLVSMSTENPPVAPSVVVPAEDMHSLFGSSESSTIEIIEPTLELSPVISPEVTSTDSLFSLGKDDAVLENSFSTPVLAIEEQKVEKILHPKEFLERSIETIDSMITDIDTAYDKKVSEALAYAQEKERLASLEKDTYEAASTLNEEKEHALHVRKLLDKELWRNEKKDTGGESLSWSIQGKEEMITAVETPLVSSDVPATETSTDLTDAPVSVKKAHTEKLEDVLLVGV